MKLFFWFFTFMPFAAAYAQVLPEISVNEHWIQLLHYQKSGNGYKSGVENGIFFLGGENGRNDPAAELKATLEKFSATASLVSSGNARTSGPGVISSIEVMEEENPFCRFPARLRWFRKYHPEIASNWPVQVCPHFDAYLKGVSGDSISLVFSSYYLNNPSSAFGHSFIRVNKPRKQDGQRYELLDYGVNYAADVDTGNALVYMVKGLSGGFRGSFTSLPYYFKVREYNNAESRDLWEYELNVTPEFVDMFVAHLWEMGPMGVRYYYLSENCSYWMLALMDATEPGYNLTARLKQFVIPSDTIRVVWDTPGLVRSFHYRPSIHTEFVTRLQGLNDIERDEVLRIYKTHKIELSDYSNEQRRKILDVALDYQDFKHAVDVQKPETAAAKFKNELLAARSQVGINTPPLKIIPMDVDKPHLGHGSRRLRVGAQASDKTGNYVHLGYRFALHDQLDPLQGYPAYSEIVFGDFDFTYSQRLGRAELEHFNLFEVFSSSSFSRFEPTPSWRVRVGEERMQISEGEYCHAGAFDLGGGYSTETGDHRLSLFGGVKGIARWMPSCNNHFLVGGGPNARLLYRVSASFNILLEGLWTYDTQRLHFEDREVTLGAQWSRGNKWGLRSVLSDKTFEKRAGLDWVLYY